MIKKKKIFVLYHKSCSSGDGFGGAYAAWKKFGSRAEYIGVNHSDVPLKQFRDAEVFMIDVTYSVEQMKKLLLLCKRVTVLDHHESAQDAITMAHEYVYDAKHSGATIAWKYFFPKEKAPMLLCYLEDADNWTFRLPHTREMLASLYMYNREFSDWARLARAWETPQGRAKYQAQGATVLLYQSQLIKKTLDDAYEVTLLGHRVFAVNSSILVSVIGNQLAQKAQAKFGIVWSRGRDIVKVSLRSYGTRDVSKIAAHFGGGGHKYSSAFILPTNASFPWKDIKK